MKTRKLLFGLALLIITAISANAQIVVTQGSTHKFSVTTPHNGTPWNYTYLWSTNGTDVVAPLAPPTANITFNDASTTKVFVTETNPLGGCPTINNYLVTILAPQTLAFAGTTSQSCAGLTAVLPFTFGGATADYYPLVINYTVGTDSRTATFLTAGETKELPLTVTDRADGATSAGPSYNVVVTLVSATANTGTVLLGTTVHTNTVYDIPDANVIIMVN